MKIIIMLCGLPRSGKSTLSKLIKKYTCSLTLVSADDLRYLIYNERYNQEKEYLVWDTRKIILKMLMQQEQTILIDETNTTKMRRKSILELADEFNYKVVCIYINTIKKICLKRCDEIGDDCIKPIIEKMDKQFEFPELSEGFLKCIYVYSDNEISVNDSYSEVNNELKRIFTKIIHS